MNIFWYDSNFNTWTFLGKTVISTVEHFWVSFYIIIERLGYVMLD